MYSITPGKLVVVAKYTDYLIADNAQCKEYLIYRPGSSTLVTVRVFIEISADRN